MHPIIYDVAVSVDGFISGPAEDISRFAHDGPVVDDYRQRLSAYATAIMGRATYEFGYRFGLEPGQNPYTHMKTYVFSKSLKCPPDAQIDIVSDPVEQVIADLKETSDGPIYLCGGGAFGSALLSLGLINLIRLKRAPILLGDGVRLFHDKTCAPELFCTRTKDYGNGYVYQEFRVGKPDP
ncbi:dihydrofolate reductase family protein [Ruegeria sp. HKCCD8929]|uniref:dihydrofolate reductase family protein n=1 Tax=Ruegeria sp. HKCCD8929 TaxID=2683006 RepID=UPI00148860A6|nr:dihydrofolate reductase family protein [Ruegeria sp. HKCCD8929]